jgi:hypothetical protein
MSTTAVRALLAHAPERLHEEITEDYNEMIYTKTPDEIEKHRKAFIRKMAALFMSNLPALHVRAPAVAHHW